MVLLYGRAGCFTTQNGFRRWQIAQSTGVMAPLLTGVLLDRGGCPSAADAAASASASGSGGGSHGS